MSREFTFPDWVGSGSKKWCSSKKAVQVFSHVTITFMISAGRLEGGTLRCARLRLPLWSLLLRDGRLRGRIRLRRGLPLFDIAQRFEVEIAALQKRETDAWVV